MFFLGNLSREADEVRKKSSYLLEAIMKQVITYHQNGKED